MVREQTFEKLYSLKLHGLAAALEEQLKDPQASSLGFEERLGMLVDAQWLWRENQALARRLRQARLKMAASMEDINYRHPRRLDRSLMQSLAGCEWVRRRHNITLTGPAGVGKTYLCCALLEKACRQGYTVYYASASKFFRQLSVAWADGSFDRLLAKLARTDVVAIDDWGLVPLADLERRHLLEVLDDRSESRSTLLTSQFPVTSWHELIGNPTLADAIVERILANSHRIELQGETLRAVQQPVGGQEASS
ncbi:MAG: IS21-like element helper ATPase IstB [Acidobacteriota bacterium]